MKNKIKKNEFSLQDQRYKGTFNSEGRKPLR